MQFVENYAVAEGVADLVDALLAQRVKQGHAVRGAVELSGVIGCSVCWTDGVCNIKSRSSPGGV